MIVDKNISSSEIKKIDNNAISYCFQDKVFQIGSSFIENAKAVVELETSLHKPIAGGKNDHFSLSL